mgnify:CR=1 FL=1
MLRLLYILMDIIPLLLFVSVIIFCLSILGFVTWWFTVPFIIVVMFVWLIRFILASSGGPQ